MHLPSSSRPPGSDHVWTATGHEPPVFLDEHGRRRRWVALAGALAGLAAALWLTALVAGAIGFATLPAIQAHSPLLAAKRPLLASRTLPLAGRASRGLALAPRRLRVRPASVVREAAELAVSRGLLATR